jgi:hypothetical protein
MSDIVERLRLHRVSSFDEYNALTIEAANEIERLRNFEGYRGPQGAFVVTRNMSVSGEWRFTQFENGEPIGHIYFSDWDELWKHVRRAELKLSKALSC